ncbi:hypothetical protein QQF64_033861 [Cirrhinus molitorella]|uniref:Uncharacterized protein n=1 Tax=Cirrhinus molitorella TaxID=172907 RepID=A0ABR3MV37_9TELE
MDGPVLARCCRSLIDCRQCVDLLVQEVVTLPSPLDSTPPAAPRRSIPPARLDSSFPPAQPRSSIAPATLWLSGSPPPPQSQTGMGQYQTLMEQSNSVPFLHDYCLQSSRLPGTCLNTIVNNAGSLSFPHSSGLALVQDTYCTCSLSHPEELELEKLQEQALQDIENCKRSSGVPDNTSAASLQSCECTTEVLRVWNDIRLLLKARKIQKILDLGGLQEMAKCGFHQCGDNSLSSACQRRDSRADPLCHRKGPVRGFCV